MRVLALCLALLPVPALADTILLDAPPVTVTVYAQGAVVTREVTFDLPEGNHVLRVENMPPEVRPEFVDVALDGGLITARSWSDQRSTPYRAPRTPEWLAARAALDAAQEALAQRDDRIALALARAKAAQDQVRFLNTLELPDQTAIDVETLRAIGQLIVSDGSAARAAVQAAEAEARALRQGREDLEFDVAQAQAALDAATPPNTRPAALSLDVRATATGQATLTLRYVNDNASWAPVYSMYLDDDTALQIDRGAAVRQQSSENWADVALTLSTLSPFRGTDPGELWPILRRIEDPEAQKRNLSRVETADAMEGLAAAPAPVVMEEDRMAIASADFSGVGVSYTLPGLVTVPTGGETVQIALDTLDFDAALSARAVPRVNETAYRQVNFANTSSDIILPGQAILYVDGQLVGQTYLETLPPNADTDVFFGPIEGLRLKRTVLDRNEGDRGLITRSNEEREEIRLEIENLTDRTWNVALRENVPYSEQEDLEIDWRADPAPDTEAVDDRRGILEWDVQIAPGETRLISIETTITWPEGMILR